MTNFEKFKSEALKNNQNETEEYKCVLKNYEVHVFAVSLLQEHDKCDACNFNNTEKCTKNIQTKNPQDNCIDGILIFLNSEVAE